MFLETVTTVLYPSALPVTSITAAVIVAVLVIVCIGIAAVVVILCLKRKRMKSSTLEVIELKEEPETKEVVITNEE